MEIYNTIPDSTIVVELVSGKVYDGVNELKPEKNLYSIKIGSNELKKDIEWLRLMSVFKPKLPSEHIDRYDNIYFVKTKSVFKREFDVPYMVAFKEPLSVFYNNIEFRVIPRYPSWGINVHGEVLNINSKKMSRCYFGGNRDYLYYGIRDPVITNHRIVVSMHRLLAMAWVPNDDWENKIIVDHVDGDKYNNSINNLQWVEASENVKRAIIMRSTDAVFCREVNGYNILSFPSLNKCCEYIGRSNIIPIITPLTPGRIWKGRKGSFYIAYSPDDLLPRFENGSEFNMVPRKNPVEAYNVSTKEYMLFPNATACSRELGIGVTAVLNRLYNESLSRCPIDGWIMRVHSNEPWDKSTLDKKPSEPVECTIINLSTGVKMNFSSKKATGRFLNTTNHVINNHIRSGKYFTRNGIQYKILGPISQ